MTFWKTYWADMLAHFTWFTIAMICYGVGFALLIATNPLKDKIGI